MKVTFWGTRGSLPSPRPGTTRYGGNTSCVSVRLGDGSDVILDAGTGIHRLADFGQGTTRVDVLLSHLHMDHIIGLGFFGALFQPDLEVHLWGPPSVTLDLHARLSRYLSPPLFPVRLRDLPCRLELHGAPRGTFDLPGATVTADLVCHPGPTLGYRLEADGAVLAYVPDHEPALAEMAGVGTLAAFHHDPGHNDSQLDRLYAAAAQERDWSFELAPACEGVTLTLGRQETVQP